MTTEKLLYELHSSRESDLLPLAAIQTETDKERYSQKGYFVPITYPEWQEKFPSIDANKVFLLGGVNFGISYYEKENLLFLNLLPLVLEQRPDKLEEVKETLADIIEKNREQVKNKTADFRMLLSSYPDGIKINGLEQLLNIVGPGATFYNAFIDTYITSDFPTHRISKKLVEALAKSKLENQKEETEKRLRERFGDTETFIGYRGMTEKSAPADAGLSWSPNINVAYRFASVFGQEHMVAQAEIKKEDIIEYISPDMGPEEEFIVLPGKCHVQNILVLSTPDSPDVLKYTNLVLPTYQTYRTKLKKLYEKYGVASNDHNALHSLRVLLFALLLAAQKGLIRAEYKQIAAAAIYHDIGRVNDATDKGHGLRSEEIYKKDGGSDNVIAFMIRNHCIDDETAKKELDGEFSSTRRDKAWLLYSILKDADALDRIRFGFAIVEGSDGLDVWYLRNDYAKKLVCFAYKAKGAITL